eukprot:g2409.t1
MKEVTVSGVLDTMNQSMAATGGSVKLQRRCDDGVMLDSTQEELALLDSQSRVKNAARALAGLTPPQKLRWARAKKDEANGHFKAGDVPRACELYLQALAGLDFGDTAQSRAEAVQGLQLPVLSNLAACMLAQQQWLRAGQLCDEALKIEPGHIKSLLRRGRARTELERFDQARGDFELLAGKNLHLLPAWGWAVLVATAAVLCTFFPLP